MNVCFGCPWIQRSAPCRCWKSSLPYSKRAENIINRKRAKFYIEAIPHFFLNSEKKSKKSIEKKFDDFFFAKNRIKNRKFQIFENLDFFENLTNFDFWSDFSRKFFSSKKNRKMFSSEIFLIFFSELRKFLGYSFDVEFSPLSIYDVFSVFWALHRPVRAPRWCWYKNSVFSY